MTLFKIEPPFRRSKKAKDPTEETRAIAERLYRNRLVTKRPGDADSDWAKAERILKSPVRRVLFRLNQPLIRAEKGAVEPVANWVDRADLFRIVERLSPTLEALGVIVGAIAIPLVLFSAAQNYEERLLQRERAYQELLQQQELERLQQQSMMDYLNQLSAILLEIEGDLRDPQNEEIRSLMTATTLTLLSDPNLDSSRKSQVIRFLSQMSLVQREEVYRAQSRENVATVVSLSNVDLSNIDLSNIDLSNADLRAVNLSKADLTGANLSKADLSSMMLPITNFSGINITFTTTEYVVTRLSNVDLRSANLSNADFSGVDLSNADLSFATFSETNLHGANLSGANLSAAQELTKSQFEETYLCETRFPLDIGLDPNRDCEQIEEKGWVPSGKS